MERGNDPARRRRRKVADESAKVSGIDWRREQLITAEALRAVRLDLHDSQDNLAYARVELKEEQSRARELEELAHHRLDQVNETAEILGRSLSHLESMHKRLMPAHRDRLNKGMPEKKIITLEGQEKLSDWCSVCHLILEIERRTK